MVVSEFEASADALLASFSDMPQAVLEVLSGKYEPSVLLPLQIPSDMKTVEEQYEDVSFDMECHEDTEGNIYDFGFGMNWRGIIADERVLKYAVIYHRL